MVKKLKALTQSDDKQLAEAVRLSAQQIWQAGLGAFAKAQEEGGKVFARLVQEGTELQKRTQKLAEDKVSDVSDTVTRVADSVGKQAAGSWDKLEKVFEDRVSRSLKSLGVPTQEDILALTARIEELSKAVDALGKKSAGSRRVSKKAGAKAAAKQTTKVAAKLASHKTGVRKTPRKAAA